MKMMIILTAISLLGFTALAQTPEELLASKGIVLPTLPKAVGNYSSLVKSGNLIYLSGRGPLQANGNYTIGKLGKDLNVQQGYAAAKLCAIAQIAVLKAELGSLSKIKRIVKVTGFVNGTGSFTEQPKVINGFSDLMVEIFGSKGIHARSAVGIAGLPSGWPVEVEMIVEIND
jgi:enamine deaminase RidA (YjgF/YER057c/UK114 family)